MAKLLLDRGADRTVVGPLGSPADVAARAGHAALAELLKRQ